MVKMQLRGVVIEPLLAGREFSACSDKYDGTLHSIKDISLLLFSGAKITYLGGGWWGITWYAHDRGDLDAFKLALL